MTLDPAASYTAFAGSRRLARGPLAEVALAAAAVDGESVLTFSDHTGRVVDLDLRGGAAEIAERYAVAAAAPESRGPGRPKLGVVAREVTLLPRHWEWLTAQRGGASQALRRLVDEARQADQKKATPKLAQERAYCFMSAIAGDLPGFEEASRALFADDSEGFAARIAGWPEDVRAYALALSGLREDPPELRS
jgi:hypothetical protein